VPPVRLELPPPPYDFHRSTFRYRTFGDDVASDLAAEVPDLALEVLHGAHGVAQGGAGRQVEGQRHRRKLAEVVDGQRRGARGEAREGAQRHLGAGGRLHVDALERVRIVLELGRDLEDHVVLVELGEDGRDLALAEGVVERVVDGLGQDGQARGEVAVDDQRGHEAAVLLIARHVAKLR